MCVHVYTVDKRDTCFTFPWKNIDYCAPRINIIYLYHSNIYVYNKNNVLYIIINTSVTCIHEQFS
jgi:hypothetical protein